MIRRLLGNRVEERALSFQDIWGRGLDETDVATASGEATKSEAAGVGADEFAPWPIGVTG